MRSRSLLLAAALLAAAMAERPPHWGGRRKGGFVRHHEVEEQKVHDSRAAFNGVEGSATVSQKIDHFNASDARVFNQRFFWNLRSNPSKTSGVNFLYLSGEQTASKNQISGDGKPIVQYADKYAGSIYGLEHRYYGESRPFADTATENLKYLTSRQAIEDIAAFIKYVNANNGTPNDKWIVVGGSYAGALSAWARMLHPELIAGSIASSAPLLAQYDFYGYLETVDKNVAKYGDCYNKLKTGIDTISGLFESSNGRKTLDSKFPVKPKLDSYKDTLQDNDIVTFFTWVTDVFEGASQYADPTTVEDLCKEFIKTADPVDALAAVLKKYNKADFTFDVNYTAGIEDMQDTSYSEDTDYTGRLWTWQTCTEFGYFQSTDRGSNVFQSTVPVNIYVDMCTDVFGLDPNTVQASIDATNAYYGERDYYTGTNVFLAHGAVDPWSYLTKQLGTSQHWSVVIVEVPDGTLKAGTHCSDLDPACDSNGDNCNPDLKRIQTLTSENIDQWLNGPYTAPDSIKLTDTVGKRPVWYDGNVGTPLSITQNGHTDAIRAKRSVSDRIKSGNKSVFGRGSGWNQFTGKSTKHRLPPPLEQAKRPDLPVNINEGYFDQPFDHFNPNDERQFQQRFFVNEIYVKTDDSGAKVKNAPNFLMIGGEGPEDGTWAQNEDYAWMTYAKEVGATVYILEHRYYGKSKLNTNDFQYLTSAQMLYDVSRFISMVKRNRGATGPWITFGGSYPGALAAWSREWFPELILGAVGSSGPVLAKNDFYEYLQVVDNVLRAKSQKCADRVQEAFDKMRQMTRDASGRAQLTKKFNIKPPWNNTVGEVVPQVNIQNFFANIYGPFQDIVQYSDDNKKQGIDYTVTELCQIMENAKPDQDLSDSIDGVRFVQNWVNDNSDNTETGSNPYDDFEEMKKMMLYINGSRDENGDVPYDDGQLAGILWTWQTCNEFGYYQTTDYGYGLFGNPVPLNFFVLMCEEVFGMYMDDIEKGVARTNYQYGGRARYSATNVVLPNGNHDPWHALGITEQGKLDASVVPILIEGTAHCADMYPARAEDPPQLVAARTTILSNIKKWLNGGSQPETPTQPTEAPPSPPTTTTSASHLSTIFALLAPIAALLMF